MEVDGISVAKATAIQNASVVSGVVNGVGHLILTTGGGTTIDAGPVNSPTLAETLANKSIALGSNPVTGTRAQFNTAMTDDDFVSLTGVEAPTNKDLSSSTNTFPAETDRLVATKGADQTVNTSNTPISFPTTVESAGLTSWNGFNVVLAHAGVYMVSAMLSYNDGGTARRTVTAEIQKGVGGGAGGTVSRAKALTSTTFVSSVFLTWVGAVAANDSFSINAFSDTAGGKIEGIAAQSQLQIVRLG